MPQILVIGIGNEFRGDDVLGLLVVREIRKTLRAKISCYEHSGDGTSLISLWEKDDVVFLVDAIYSKSQSTDIYRLNLKEENLPVEWFYSTHAFNLAEAIELARILGQLPREIILYGVRGKNFEIGQEISPNVYQAVEKIVSQILKEIDEQYLTK